MLVDSNGHLILNSTLDVIYALVWNEESGIIDVNDQGRYNTQLTEWIVNFGESQYSYSFYQTNQYTIIAGSDEEDIEFNDATGEWSPALTLFEPIEPLGKLQVFKDQNCTEYADGTENAVYVRVNQNFGFGDNEVWALGGEQGKSAVVATPTDENPSDGYSIGIWWDWNSDGEYNGFTAGDIIRCPGTGSTVQNPTVIFY